MLETYIGGMAAAIGICISLPQIWKTFHSKQAKDISLSMWVLLLAAQTLWLTYALIRGDTILLVANVVAAVQSVTMLMLIHTYRR